MQPDRGDVPGRTILRVSGVAAHCGRRDVYFRARAHERQLHRSVESDGLFYLIHGDVTYTDVAFYENKLSVVYEDKAAARETLDRCRAFCAARPTVWLGTHTPEALESLGAKRVVDLANPPSVIPPGEIVFKTPTGKYVCSVCGYVYDPAENSGVAFEALPADWRCPRCKQTKDKFNRA